MFVETSKNEFVRKYTNNFSHGVNSVLSQNRLCGPKQTFLEFTSRRFLWGCFENTFMGLFQKHVQDSIRK